MSAVRHIPLRWINADGPPVRERARGPIVIALVCVAIFACFYTVGHVTVSTTTTQPATAATPGLPITYTGAAVPARLANAAAIGALATSRGHRGSRSAANANANATPTVVATQPAAPTAIAAPAPVATPTPTPAAHTPAHRSQPHSGGGVSFDSSG